MFGFPEMIKEPIVERIVVAAVAVLLLAIAPLLLLIAYTGGILDENAQRRKRKAFGLDR